MIGNEPLRGGLGEYFHAFFNQSKVLAILANQDELFKSLAYHPQHQTRHPPQKDLARVSVVHSFDKNSKSKTTVN